MMTLISSELIKLARRPGVFFWGFVAPGFGALTIRIFMQLLLLYRVGDVMWQKPDPILSTAKMLNVVGGPLAQLFLAFGIGSIFFCDYRYSTWRLLVPRASRAKLWLAKFVCCALAVSLGLIVAAIADISFSLILSFSAGDGSDGASLRVSSLPALGLAFSISMLEFSVLAALVSLITISTRSLVPAVFAVFLLAVVGYFLPIILETKLIGFPSNAADGLRAYLFGKAPGAWREAGILLLWLVSSTMLSLWVFQRQELATE